MAKSWRGKCGKPRLKCQECQAIEKERDQLKGALQFEKDRADGLAEELNEIEDILAQVEEILEKVVLDINS